ncbi:MAG: hypothetical protein IJV46_06895 [Acidaminococcaceae bacterium]|nr:hypothetical protein [Acidaminococcaceae bacterium]
MFILGQTGEIIINADYIECVYEQPEQGVPAIKARTRSLNVTLGLYKTKEAIDRAMAHLGLALMAGDANRLRMFAMPADPPGRLPVEDIHQTDVSDPEEKEDSSE